ncbi:hypothetical protein PoB_000586800 [Plakobranchus ocellatus]|uniref:Uncharacterized protein n=1 Tax=Plakobranchus ocellatus TaxID=259542 RepID=A0AAV3YA77_9GAST|nr:hypothetical protein PoB_000586800 [Plakobranchus ocellatus]
MDSREEIVQQIGLLEHRGERKVIYLKQELERLHEKEREREEREFQLTRNGGEFSKKGIEKKKSKAVKGEEEQKARKSKLADPETSSSGGTNSQARLPNLSNSGMEKMIQTAG